MHRLFFSICFCFFYIIVRAQLGYEEEIRNWDSSRVFYLKSENGWLNLVGLIWLSEGRNSFGADPGNKIILRGKGIPARAGYFELNNGAVRMFTEASSGVKVDGKVKIKALIYHADSSILPVCSLGSLRWTIKRSDNQYGMRLRDLEHKAVKEFHGLERYPIDTSWRVRAYLRKAPWGYSNY